MNFSITADRSVYFNDNQAKIEIMHCPSQRKECVKQLPDINRCFLESHYARLDKNYKKAIESLSEAFQLTYEIEETNCGKCVELFRSIIVDSLGILHSELKSMTTGWFKARRFTKDLEKASTLLEQLKLKTSGS